MIMAAEKKEPKVFCRECGILKDLPADTDEAMVAMTLQYCGDCYFWHRLEVIKEDPNVARIDGKHYFIGPETSLEVDPPKWRGMSGARVVIKFNDGRKVVSTNFWYQGVIPERWRERMPNNAEFVRQK